MRRLQAGSPPHGCGPDAAPSGRRGHRRTPVTVSPEVGGREREGQEVTSYLKKYQLNLPRDAALPSPLTW